MTTAGTDRDPAVELGPYPLWRRVVDVVVAPGRLFERFRYETPWFGALLVVVIVGVVAALLIPQELYVEQAREAIHRAEEQGARMPSVEQMASFARIAAAAGSALAPPIMAFVIAGVLALAFTVVGDGNAGYAQYLTVTTHAMLIVTLGVLVTLPVQVLAGDLSVRLSLALFAPGLEAGVAHTVLQGLELFAIWGLVVMGVGVAVVNRRSSWIAPTTIVLGLYLLMLLAIALISAR